MGCCDSAAIPPLCFSQHTVHRPLIHTKAYTHSINAQTQQPSFNQVIPQAGAGITFATPSRPRPEFHSQSLMCAQEWGRGRRISVLFLSAVCLHSVAPWIRMSMCGFWLQGYWYNGVHTSVRCCERGTQSDTGTARRICLHCWSLCPPWHAHALDNS